MADITEEPPQPPPHDATDEVRAEYRKKHGQWLDYMQPFYFICSTRLQYEQTVKKYQQNKSINYTSTEVEVNSYGIPDRLQ